MAARVFMRDVAAQSGFHRTTVSLALRGHPRIPPATREKIVKIANQLGYRVDPFLAALMHAKRVGASTPKNAVIAFITSSETRYGWQTDPRIPKLFPGAAARAGQLGFKLEHFWAFEPGMTAARLSDILATRNIQGVILAPPPPTVTSLDLDWSRFSVVSIGVGLAKPEVHRVHYNHYQTSAMALRQCVERGYRRIAFCSQHLDEGYRPLNERWLGAYSAAAFEFVDATLLPPYFVEYDQPQKLIAWIEKQKPEAIIGPEPVIELLLQKRKLLPPKIGLVSLNLNQPDHKIAGVYYDSAMLGATAIDWLASLMYQCQRGLPVQAHGLNITGRWVDGQTLGVRRASA